MLWAMMMDGYCTSGTTTHIKFVIAFVPKTVGHQCMAHGVPASHIRSEHLCVGWGRFQANWAQTRGDLALGGGGGFPYQRLWAIMMDGYSDEKSSVAMGTS
jgi:hypothetical protein